MSQPYSRLGHEVEETLPAVEAPESHAFPQYNHDEGNSIRPGRPQIDPAVSPRERTRVRVQRHRDQQHLTRAQQIVQWFADSQDPPPTLEFSALTLRDGPAPSSVPDEAVEDGEGDDGSESFGFDNDVALGPTSPTPPAPPASARRDSQPPQHRISLPSTPTFPVSPDAAAVSSSLGSDDPVLSGFLEAIRQQDTAGGPDFLLAQSDAYDQILRKFFSHQCDCPEPRAREEPEHTSTLPEYVQHISRALPPLPTVFAGRDEACDPRASFSQWQSFLSDQPAEPLSFRKTQASLSQDAVTIARQWDVDSVWFGARSLSAIRAPNQFRLSFFSPHTSNISTAQVIQPHGLDLAHTRHTIIGTFTTAGVRFSVLMFFPSGAPSQTRASTNSLSLARFRDLYDEIILPAVRETERNLLDSETTLRTDTSPRPEAPLRSIDEQASSLPCLNPIRVSVVCGATLTSGQIATGEDEVEETLPAVEAPESHAFPQYNHDEGNSIRPGRPQIDPAVSPRERTRVRVQRHRDQQHLTRAQQIVQWFADSQDPPPTLEFSALTLRDGPAPSSVPDEAVEDGEGDDGSESFGFDNDVALGPTSPTPPAPPASARRDSQPPQHRISLPSTPTFPVSPDAAAVSSSLGSDDPVLSGFLEAIRQQDTAGGPDFLLAQSDAYDQILRKFFSHQCDCPEPRAREEPEHTSTLPEYVQHISRALPPLPTVFAGRDEACDPRASFSQWQSFLSDQPAEPLSFRKTQASLSQDAVTIARQWDVDSVWFGARSLSAIRAPNQFRLSFFSPHTSNISTAQVIQPHGLDLAHTRHTIIGTFTTAGVRFSVLMFFPSGAPSQTRASTNSLSLARFRDLYDEIILPAVRETERNLLDSETTLRTDTSPRPEAPLRSIDEQASSLPCLNPIRVSVVCGATLTSGQIATGEDEVEETLPAVEAPESHAFPQYNHDEGNSIRPGRPQIDPAVSPRERTRVRVQRHRDQQHLTRAQQIVQWFADSQDPPPTLEFSALTLRDGPAPSSVPDEAVEDGEGDDGSESFGFDNDVALGPTSPTPPAPPASARRDSQPPQHRISLPSTPTFPVSPDAAAVSSSLGSDDPVLSGFLEAIRQQDTAGGPDFLLAQSDAYDQILRKFFSHQCDCPEPRAREEPEHTSTLPEYVQHISRALPPLPTVFAGRDEACDPRASFSQWQSFLSDQPAEPLSFRKTQASLSQDAVTIARQWDVDSVWFGARSLSAIRAPNQFRLSFFSPHTSNISTAQVIQPHGLDLAHTRHTIIGTFTTAGVRFSVLMFFPSGAPSQTRASTNSLSLARFRDLYDEIILPAVRETERNLLDSETTLRTDTSPRPEAPLRSIDEQASSLPCLNPIRVSVVCGATLTSGQIATGEDEVEETLPAVEAPESHAFPQYNHDEGNSIRPGRPQIDPAVSPRERTRVRVQRHRDQQHLTRAQQIVQWFADSQDPPPTLEFSALTLRDGPAPSSVPDEAVEDGEGDDGSESFGFDNDVALGPTSPTPPAPPASARRDSQPPQHRISLPSTPTFPVSPDAAAVSSSLGSDDPVLSGFLEAIRQQDTAGGPDFLLAQSDAYDQILRKFFSHQCDCPEPRAREEPEHTSTLPEYVQHISRALPPLPTVFAGRDEACDPRASFSQWQSFLSDQPAEPLSFRKTQASLSQDAVTIARQWDVDSVWFGARSLSAIRAPNQFRLSFFSPHTSNISTAQVIQPHGLDLAHTRHTIIGTFTTAGVRFFRLDVLP
ncbi:hypothetical protein HZS61_016922 [Fusarium oxysporum f. sp. conglutinans]|uniref:Uncharacterized protein n=1 Tax=Fusarium oxysporum f. sp. conglutinans TaxID=100902 RepID=A0A8H6LJ15_FUSOX|nr:hypothetical protein HZS61_016922 [Fusarium oxysporum f. sp. conglutinans]